MGLFLAKEYIKNETLKEDNGIPLDYKGKISLLRINERFFCVDDDFIELMYTGDEIKITYGNEDRIMFSNVNGMLIFMIIQGLDESKGRQNITYPLTMSFSSLSLIKYTEKEYENSKNTVMKRYLEYRD
jgi:hypothetical protein